MMPEVTETTYKDRSHPGGIWDCTCSECGEGFHGENGATVCFVCQPDKAQRKPVQRICTNVDGTLDDIFITGDFFRMEQMDDDCWWLAIYRGKKRVSFNLVRKGKKIKAILQDDELDCEYDSPKVAK